MASHMSMFHGPINIYDGLDLSKEAMAPLSERSERKGPEGAFSASCIENKDLHDKPCRLDSVDVRG